MKQTYSLMGKSLKRRELLVSVLGTLTCIAIKPSSNAQTQSSNGLSENTKAVLQELEKMQGRYSNVPPSDGQFLNMLINIAKAQNVLEVGTSNGYSAIWIALALVRTGGFLTTIEIDHERVMMAKDNLKKAGLASRVKVIEGDAHKIVPTLEGKFDFVFLDADKGREHDYFSYLYPNKLKPGSIILVHNAIQMKGMMRRYIELISSHPEFDTVFVSTTLKDGFILSFWKVL